MTRVLLDTHVLLWSQNWPERLPATLYEVMARPEMELVFSTASVWEVAIKHSQARADFQADPGVLRQKLLDTGYVELPVLGPHAVTVATLPWIHKDPFDRLLVAQAIVEGVELLTVDELLARYPGPIRVF
ncbi:twitching motility protein PilT [Devosia insulae DS-56]|uniref:Twitching motility protein PilT n=1 Tax=Devosia insulae DS-56 TaxID=1116389 RepID=A0A1E5XI20_9HYPH|nr:type II toxin-antitoxin system VapC family toxin [Devosia insulae]OEO28247.1 twitching motility protein PilT [Devosia insulae DS-56]